MIKTILVNLAQSASMLVAPSNQARKGFKVIPLGTSSPLVTVAVRKFRAVVLTDTAEVQTLTPTGVPTEGTFKIACGEDKTTALAYNASAGTIQTAVRLLPGCAAVTVSGTMATAVVLTLTSAKWPTGKLRVTDSTMKTAGTVAVKTVTFNSITPEVGSFRLRFRKVVGASETVIESPAYAYDTSAATLQAALILLLGDLSLTATGSIAGGFVITFGDKGQRWFIEVFENTLAAVTEEVQSVDLSDATPEAGTFKLRYNDDLTTALALNANAAAVQAALRLLPGLERVTVAGSLAAGTMAVTFVGVRGVVGSLVPEQVGLHNQQNQLLEFDLEPAAGGYVLSFGGNSTTQLAFNANAAAIQAALRLLPGLESVTVSGDYTAGFTIVMVGAGDAALITAAGVALVDGSAAASTPAVSESAAYLAITVAVTVDTPGGTETLAPASVAATTAEAAQLAVTCPPATITTPGDRAADKQDVAQGSTLDESASGHQGSIYLWADTACAVKVEEIF